MLKFLFVILLTSNFAMALSGNYTVPIQNSAASNPLTNIQISREFGKFKLRYFFPEDLVGLTYTPLELTLLKKKMGSSGIQILFADKGAVATCRGLQTGLSCHVVYEKSEADPADQMDFLKKKYAHQPQLLSNKMLVARSFSSDPIGVLDIYCPQHSCGL